MAEWAKETAEAISVGGFILSVVVWLAVLAGT
jgi:hypothetical protein